jgi:hypothetical protein
VHTRSVPHPWTPRSAVPAPTSHAWRLDGADLHAQEFRSAEPVDVLLTQYRADWRSEQPGEPVVDSTVGAWRVLGQRVGRSFRTAQFRAEPDGATRVLLSRGRPGAPAGRTPAVPLPPAATVIRRLEIVDGSRRALQVYGVARTSRRAAEAGLESAARRAGWDPVAASHRTTSAAVRAWQRDGFELLVVTTQSAAGTGFLLHVTPVAGTASTEPP